MLIESQLHSLQKKRFFFNNIKFGAFLSACLVSYIEVLSIKVYIKPQLPAANSPSMVVWAVRGGGDSDNGREAGGLLTLLWGRKS